MHESVTFNVKYTNRYIVLTHTHVAIKSLKELRDLLTSVLHSLCTEIGLILYGEYC